MMAPRPANENRVEVPAGQSYYPEMGERAPAGAIIEASLSHYGRHYYLKFATSKLPVVMKAIADQRLRVSDLETYDSCITGESKTTLRMTVAAYDKLRSANKALCTMQMLLD